ncbi:MAG: NADH:ubiquinone reductase (Na(+)-transporting) subunit C [Bacteroidales bacterium]|nr:NADH:ubiquinone reductase (Na(+)-transporting) subunit C [Bacteroidales bacterium]
MYSNRYIFIYSSVMVIVVAAILSSAASLLKPIQDRNVRTAKMIDILSSAGIESDKTNAEGLYSKYIVREEAVNLKGEIISLFEDGRLVKGVMRPFEINLKEEQHKKKEFESGKDATEPLFPVFVCRKESGDYYILPLLGKGLWGPVWGNIALEEDLTTVYGVNFGHKSETPGLGAEIDKPDFQKPFAGKLIFDENGRFTSVKVVKGGVQVLPEKERIHGVDAITGGTITSVGVSDMLYDGLSNYLEYFKKTK